MTEVWHQSGLQAVLRCGEAYRRRYLEKEGRPPVTALIRGAAVHRGIAVGLGEQMRQGNQPPPPDLMEDVAATEVDRARHGGATLTEEERSVGLARTFGALKDAAVGYAGAYARQVAPTITPVAVERRITVEGTLPGITLRGTLDLVTRDAEGEVIRDEKTSERAPSANAADVSSQLSMYALLRTVETGQPVTRVALDVLVRSKATGAVTPVHRASSRGPEDFRALLARIQVASAAVKAGIFLPASPETDWWCSLRWCEYAATCKYFHARAG